MIDTNVDLTLLICVVFSVQKPKDILANTNMKLLVVVVLYQALIILLQYYYSVFDELF